MIEFFYPMAYAISALGLILWQHYQDHDRKSNLARMMFVVGFISYILLLATADVPLNTKLFVGFRDLLILAMVNWFFQFLKPRSRAFWTVLLFGFVVFQFFGASRMSASLAGKNAHIEIPVDENGEWLVELEANANMDLFKLRLKGVAVMRPAFHPKDVNNTVLDNYYIVDVMENTPAAIKKVGRIIEASADVNWLEPNEKITLWPEAHGQDQFSLAQKLNVNDPDVDKQWALDALGMNEYYAFLRKQQLKVKKKTVLAILDTGVDAKHEDLKDNFQSTEIRSNNDPVGHGTHCAGIAGAVTNNNIGIASLNEGNRYFVLTSIKVLNANGMGTQESIIDGILKAADAGVDVISMSLGGRTGKRKQRAYEKAVKYANKKGAIVVVAAGNDNRNANTVTPANVPGVITVTAVDSTLTRALFSNYINDIDMAIAAPGVDIYSTIPNNQYVSFNGTSMATPFVAGLVAVMKSIRPKLTTKQIHKILKNSGKVTRNPTETGRFIQPKQALGNL